MKNVFRNTGLTLLTVAILAACSGNPSSDSGQETVEKVSQKKELSVDEKAKNMFTNTMVVFSGTMFLAFSDLFKGQAEVFAEAFNAEMNEEAIKALDQKIAGLSDETMVKLEEMKTALDNAYDSVAKVDRTMYDKIFLHSTMKEGIAIAEKYDMPQGFKPLTENLTAEEVKRYIVKIAVDGQDTTDAVIKSFAEIAMWMQKVGPELEKDAEIKAFMNAMK